MRVLGKPELSNAIKLVDLETLMYNFGTPGPQEMPQNEGEDGRQLEADNREMQEL